MKKTNTKRALGMSLISLLACGIMFAGSTYAWFTDSVEVKGNKIETGTLKVDLKILNGEKFESLRDATAPVFGGVLWEPGYTDFAVLKVENEGNLAVKWNLSAVKVGADAKGLANVIDVYTLESDTKLAAPTSLKDSAYTRVGTLADVLAKGTLLEGTFDANKTGAAKYLGIMLHMQEEAGNQYQGADDVAFDLKLNAYQLNQEVDGFGNPDYDVNAYFDGKPADSFKDDLTDNVLEISTPAELALFANTVNKDGQAYSGKTVKLVNDINLSNQPWTPIGQTRGYGAATYFCGTFDGNGYTISNLSITAASEGANYATGLFGFIDADAATIQNLTIANATVNGHHWTGAIAGYLTGTIDNCKVLNSTISATIANDDANGDKVGALVGYVNESSSVVSNSLVDNCKVTGYRDVGGVAGGGNGKLTNNTVKNSTITSTTNNNAQVAGEIVGKRFESIVENCSTENNTLNHFGLASTDAELNSAINSGRDTIVLGSGSYIIPDSAQGKTLTIIGNGDTVIATQDDGSYEGCDYSLDGATVTFQGVNITTDSTVYTGYARLNATYIDCTINGTYTLYGDSTFENCTFNVTGDTYNIWTWGAPTATFTNCTFNSSGKAILLYGNNNTVLTVNKCTFNDANDYADVNNKAAIEVGSDWSTDTKTIIANNCVVNGFDITSKGLNTGTTLWGNKNSLSTTRLSVTINGTKVY